MKRLTLVLFAAYALGLSACAGCKSDDEIVLPPEETVCPASNEPVIVRTELDPKEGKAPLTVRFNVQGEDDDEDFCEDELLLYHFDFDGDGFEDGKPRKSGKNVDYTYTKPGDYRVTIWVTDAAEQASKKSNKFVKVGQNTPPKIKTFRVQPAQGQRPLYTQISWTWEDSDGIIERFELDLGDGTVRSQSLSDSPSGGLQTLVAHTYYALGDHRVKLRIFDDTGASDEAEATVVVFAQALPSNFIQTMGSTRALAINDNDGAHFSDARGRFDYGIVAGSEVDLKVLRYPLAAFSVTEPSGQTAELIGLADPSQSGYSKDVVTFKNIAVTVGNGGMYAYNFYAPGTPCVNPWDTNCYPGTPTAPATYCNDDKPYMIGGVDFSTVALISPSASGTTWAIANFQPGVVSSGGLYALRLDGASSATGIYHEAKYAGVYDTYTPATGRLTGAVFTSAMSKDNPRLRPAVGDVVRSGGASSVIRSVQYDTTQAQYYVVIGENIAGFPVTAGNFAAYTTQKQQGDCWSHSGLTAPFAGYQNALGRQSHDMKVAGDYAYIGVAQEGLLVVNLGYALNNLGSCNNAACFQSQITWRLNQQPSWQNMEHTAYGVELTESRPVAGSIAPAKFLGRDDVTAGMQSPKYPTCDENQTPNSVKAGGIPATTATSATLRTAQRIYPNNRVAIAYDNASTAGVLTNGGAGFLVTANVGEWTVVEGNFTGADPSTWTTVTLHGAVGYAKLPSYPGRNEVTITGAQAGQIGRNALCLNFVNSYAPITAPVNVSFTTAPLLVANVHGVYYTGIVAFDRTNPASPVQLNKGALPYMGYPLNLESHRDHLFISWGENSPIKVLDLSDPYHLVEASTRTETFGGYSNSFASNKLLYRVTENNPEGVLLVAAGAMGVAGYYVADLLAQGPGVLTSSCNSSATCRNWVDDLQLRHEGQINDIKLVGDQYALVAQSRGGVLVFDVSGVAAGGDPQFVSHIRTKDNPLQVRVVDDGAGNDIVYIADNTSLFRIPFTDPTQMGTHVGNLVRGKATATRGYSCVDGSVGKIFACASVFRDPAGNEYDEGDPAKPSTALPTPKLFFGNTVTLPTYEILQQAGSSSVNTCVWGGKPVIADSGTWRIWTDMLAGRLFLFGESMYGVMMREIILQGGVPQLVDAGGGRMVARSCQWWQQNLADWFASYQNRPGVWKRLYTSNEYTNISIFDIDALEDKLGDPDYNLAQRWPRLSTLDLAPIAGYSAKINRLMAVGPYLFVSAGESGAWVIDAGDGYNPKVVGSSRLTAPGTKAAALNVVAYPDELGGTYTYLMLLSDNRQGGGIRLLRFPALAAP